MTLNEIAQIIADRLNHPFDQLFLERIKATILVTREGIIKETIQRNGLDDNFVQAITVCLSDVTPDDPCSLAVACCNPDIGLTVKRSTTLVANPIKVGADPFNYVGSIDRKKDITFRPFESLKYALKGNRFTGNATTYDFRNGYLYVTNFSGNIAVIENPFLDPTSIISCCWEKSLNSAGLPKLTQVHTCISADDTFPITGSAADKIIEKIVRSERDALQTGDNEISISPQEPS